jgi:hypothetical protein
MTSFNQNHTRDTLFILGLFKKSHAHLRVLWQGEVLFTELSFLKDNVQRMLPEDEGKAKEQGLALSASALCAELCVCLQLVAAADAEFRLWL